MTTVDLQTFERNVRSLDKARPPAPSWDELVATARALVADGRGVLAADESGGTAAKRLDAVGVEGAVENRRTYRQLLFTAPGLEEHVSGVILYDETFWQQADDGSSFPALLADRGMLPGIKADTGTKPLAGHEGEEVTAGVDGLRDRLSAYRDAGARFAKWRAVIRIGDGTPSRGCLVANAHAMARYAALCQEAGIVPMVEPEVVMDGGHDLAACEAATTAILDELYDQLADQRVLLEATILKVNMVLPGSEADPVDVDEVARATMRCLRRSVPAAVPGVAFLSGGQSPRDATVHLDAINREGEAPWARTFSYARALQEPALDAWRGDPSRVEDAQAALVHRARCNAAASTGTWKPEMEDDGA